SGICSAIEQSSPIGTRFDSPGRSEAEPWVIGSTPRSPKGARFLKPSYVKMERGVWRRLRREATRLLTPVVWRCSQKESRPLGALRLALPRHPGLNALGCRISPLLGLPGDCVAREWEQIRPQSALLRTAKHRSVQHGRQSLGTINLRSLSRLWLRRARPE